MNNLTTTDPDICAGKTSGMRKYLHRFQKVTGIDRSVSILLVGQVWGLIAGPITLFCLVRSLDSREQGYYYTFSSLLQIRVFFELGMTYVISQFASHEKANLAWTAIGTLEGDAAAKARLASLLRLGLYWYSIMALLVLVFLSVVGFYFFQSSGDASSTVWLPPWQLAVIATTGSLVISPALAILGGTGLVVEVAMLQVLGQAIGNVFLWSGLVLGMGLYTVFFVALSNLAVNTYWLLNRRRRFFLGLFQGESSASINWWGEVWPLQWKIALSWLSGYFIFQLFNPILFRYQGPEVAGRMGLSISLTSLLTSGAMSWINTRAPRFGELAARREYKELDRSFDLCLIQSLGMVALGGGVLFAAILWLRWSAHPWGQRLLPPVPFGLLVATGIVFHVVHAMAAYLRAHKQEPFFIVYTIQAVLMAAGTYYFGRYYGAVGITANYLVITLVVGLGGGSWVFYRKRNEWHGKAPCMSDA